MKKMITFLTLGLMVVSAVGCSSTPKQEDPPADQSVSAASDIEEEAAPAEETASTDETPASTSSSTSTSDLSLGAGSSGRGH